MSPSSLGSHSWVIRPESRSDADNAAIRLVNQAAFGQPAEADLVDALRASARPFLSIGVEQGRLRRRSHRLQPSDHRSLMRRLLLPGCLTGRSGTIGYHPAFEGL